MFYVFIPRSMFLQLLYCTVFISIRHMVHRHTYTLCLKWRQNTHNCRYGAPVDVPGEQLNILPVVVVAAVDGAVADEACQLWVQRALTVPTGQTADVPRDPECCQVVAVDDYPLTGGTNRPRTGRPAAARSLGVVVDVVDTDLATFVGRRRWAVDRRRVGRDVAGCWREVSRTQLCRHVTAWWLLHQQQHSVMHKC